MIWPRVVHFCSEWSTGIGEFIAVLNPRVRHREMRACAWMLGLGKKPRTIARPPLYAELPRKG